MLPQPSNADSAALPKVPEQIRNWNVGSKIGSGSFGQIHAAVHRESGVRVAVKFEPLDCPHPQLFYEAKVLKALRGIQGIPHVYWYGVCEAYCVMVLERLGPSLEEIFSQCNRRFSVPTTSLVGLQMLRRIRRIHEHDFLHRDVKPDNFLMGPQGSSRCNFVYAIDFGLAKRYRDSRGRHIPYREGKSLTGTARYVSITTHLGIEQSRRDDIEGLAYVLLYFLRGSLPWQGLRAAGKKDKYHKIMRTKVLSDPAKLCRDLPSELMKFLVYAQGLNFENEPNYEMLASLLKNAAWPDPEVIPAIPQFDWHSAISSNGCEGWRQQIHPSHAGATGGPDGLTNLGATTINAHDTGLGGRETKQLELGTPLIVGNTTYKSRYTYSRGDGPTRRALRAPDLDVGGGTVDVFTNCARCTSRDYSPPNHTTIQHASRKNGSCRANDTTVDENDNVSPRRIANKQVDITIGLARPSQRAQTSSASIRPVTNTAFLKRSITSPASGLERGISGPTKASGNVAPPGSAAPSPAPSGALVPSGNKDAAGGPARLNLTSMDSQQSRQVPGSSRRRRPEPPVGLVKQRIRPSGRSPTPPVDTAADPEYRSRLYPSQTREENIPRQTMRTRPTGGALSSMVTRGSGGHATSLFATSHAGAQSRRCRDGDDESHDDEVWRLSQQERYRSSASFNRIVLAREPPQLLEPRNKDHTIPRKSTAQRSTFTEPVPPPPLGAPSAPAATLWDSSKGSEQVNGKGYPPQVRARRSKKGIERLDTASRREGPIAGDLQLTGVPISTRRSEPSESGKENAPATLWARSEVKFSRGRSRNNKNVPEEVRANKISLRKSRLGT